MAISFDNLTNGVANDVTTIDTASITPSANKLVLLSVTARNGIPSEPATPTITGNGLTWVLVDSIYYVTSGASRRKQFVFRAMGASPSTGAITINFGETTTILWSVDQATGADVSGTNGSGAIVQSATNKDEASSTSLTVTLSAFGNTGNATFGSFGASNQTLGISPGDGFSELSENAGTFSTKQEVEWKATNDTSVDISYSSQTGVGGVAIEIKAAASTVVKDLIMAGMIPFAR